MHRSIKPLDVTPVPEAQLYTAAQSRNWAVLGRILEPVEEFFVTTSEHLVFLDKTRAMFDASYNADGYGIVDAAVIRSSVSTRDLKSLLRLGLNPDNHAGAGSHPSILCGELGYLGAAKCVFLCRPNMIVDDLCFKSPLETALSTFTVSLSLLSFRQSGSCMISLLLVLFLNTFRTMMNGLKKPLFALQSPTTS